MSAVLLHLWGPFAIHTYGLFIAIGLIIFILLVMRDPRFKRLSLENSFFDSVTVGIFSAIFGGRLLYIFSEKEPLNSFIDFFAFWQGGLAILGGVIGAIVGLSFFLHYKKIPILPFFDLIAIYAPLLQAISRLGCFYAGCCYGVTCHNTWAVIYTDENCYAPLNIYIHPTQLYSAAILFALFLLLFFYVRHKKMYHGFIVNLYIFCIAAERFLVDFWRDHRCMVTTYFSYNQYVAVGLILVAIISFISLSYIYKKKR
jgi:phosphatidylglycerol---prolipoprotein diacylglyceryl transferase